MKGMFGKLLEIDLSAKSFLEEEIPENYYKEYLGGKGLGARLLLDKNPPGVDPLSPENHILFLTGPACGFPIWGANRYVVITKSPQTRIFCESYSGGKAFLQIARCGYDAIVIKGSLESWCYLEIRSGSVGFKEASSLRGKDSFETESSLLQEYKKEKPGVLTIGPAGENLVKFAYINNDFGRCAGRAGAGAVLGSKKIKALVIIGDVSKEAHDPDLLQDYRKFRLKEGRDHASTRAYHANGTPLVVNLTTKVDAFPARYWTEGTVDHVEKINAEALHTTCKVKPRSCLYCFIACVRNTTVLDGRHEGLELDGPEYETINVFGGLNLVDDIREIAFLNDLCDRLGIDTISAGNITAFAIEASKAGKIDFPIDYNQVDRIAELLKMIVYKEGVGALFAEGSRAAAAELKMEDRAIHVKGLEPPGYDPRYLQGMGLGYAISDRGACHLRSTFYKPELAGLIDPQSNEGKVEMLLEYEDRITIYDTLVLCRFYRDMIYWDELATILKCTMGLETDETGLKAVAKRIALTIREFNLREGMNPEEDFLPEWFFNNKVGKNGYILEKKKFQELVDGYYRMRGFEKQ